MRALRPCEFRLFGKRKTAVIDKSHSRDRSQNIARYAERAASCQDLFEEGEQQHIGQSPRVQLLLRPFND